MTKFIAYYRVSTDEQRKSGLGLKAQKTAVETYVKSVNGQIVSEYRDIETAGTSDVISITSNITLISLLRKRPRLVKAINIATVNQYVLIVKEFSRLSRFSLLIDYLFATGVKFICADSPYDDPLIVKIKVALFEQERLNISERTRVALAEKKKKLGYAINPKHIAHMQKCRKKTGSMQKAGETKRRYAAMHDDYRRAYVLAIEMFRENKTAKEIIDLCAKIGLKTVKGNIIRHGTLIAIMQNEYITGEM